MKHTLAVLNVSQFLFFILFYTLVTPITLDWVSKIKRILVSDRLWCQVKTSKLKKCLNLLLLTLAKKMYTWSHNCCPIARQIVCTVSCLMYHKLGNTSSWKFIVDFSTVLLSLVFLLSGKWYFLYQIIKFYHIPQSMQCHSLHHPELK